MSSPDLSIVVPDLDSPLVDRTLAALAAQEGVGGAVEILVVGRDRPGRVPRGGAVRFLEHETVLSPAAARNRGVAAARGRALFFTDADCRPRPDWMATLRRALERAPVVGGAVTFPRRGNRWALADNIASFHSLLPDRPAEDDTRGLLGSLNLAVRRDAWECAGPFDEELVTSEDIDWVLRAREGGLPTSFEPAAVVEHAAVRADRAAVEAHAAWYGRQFHAFRSRHPEAFATGPSWHSRRSLARTAPLKAWTGALAIFLAHRRELAGSLAALPGVAVFRRAWYRAVLATWPEEEG